MEPFMLSTGDLGGGGGPQQMSYMYMGSREREESVNTNTAMIDQAKVFRTFTTGSFIISKTMQN